MTTMIVDLAHVATRHLRALLRQPYYVAVTLVQPVIWLLLFGQLFRRVVQIPGFAADSYVAFLTPGIVVMTALFSNGWSGMAYVLDIDRGVLDRFLVSPVRRGSLVTGQLGHQAVTTVAQSLVILALGLLAGARFHGGAPSVLVFLVAIVLLGAAFASFSNALALLLRRQESVVAAVNFLVLPLSFLSSTFMPGDLLLGWIHGVARFNPVNWAVEVGRETLRAGRLGAGADPHRCPAGPRGRLRVAGDPCLPRLPAFRLRPLAGGWHPGGMPRYEHRCRACGHTFVVSRPMAESALPATCPAGHEDTVRLLSTVALTGSRPAAAPTPGPIAGGCCGGSCGCG